MSLETQRQTVGPECHQHSQRLRVIQWTKGTDPRVLAASILSCQCLTGSAGRAAHSDHAQTVLFQQRPPRDPGLQPQGLAPITDSPQKPPPSQHLPRFPQRPLTQLESLPAPLRESWGHRHPNSTMQQDSTDHQGNKSSMLGNKKMTFHYSGVLENKNQCRCSQKTKEKYNWKHRKPQGSSVTRQVPPTPGFTANQETASKRK